MNVKFVGGPYDGMEVDHQKLNQNAQLFSVIGEAGGRSFALMPPRDVWDRLQRGECVEAGTLYPYEQFTGDTGMRFEKAAPDAVQRAQSESRLKVHSRAATGLGALSYGERRQVIEAADALQHEEPTRWPRDKVIRLSTTEPVFLLRVSPELRAFIRTPESGGVLLDDIVRKETLKLFRQHQEAEVPSEGV